MTSSIACCTETHFPARRGVPFALSLRAGGHHGCQPRGPGAIWLLVAGLILLVPALALGQVLSAPSAVGPSGATTKPIAFPTKCDSSGSPGNATCQAPAGQAAIAASASTITITNGLVTPTSIVTATLQRVDATCTVVGAVVPAAGSFTINVNASCTVATKVGWIVFR